MNIPLSPRAEKWIQKKLAAGQYSRPEDVVLAGLAMLEQEAPDEFAPGELERLIAEGEASLLREGPIPAEQVFGELRQLS